MSSDGGDQEAVPHSTHLLRAVTGAALRSSHQQEASGSGSGSEPDESLLDAQRDSCLRQHFTAQEQEFLSDTDTISNDRFPSQPHHHHQKQQHVPLQRKQQQQQHQQQQQQHQQHQHHPSFDDSELLAASFDAGVEPHHHDNHAQGTHSWQGGSSSSKLDSLGLSAGGGENTVGVSVGGGEAPVLTKLEPVELKGGLLARLKHEYETIDPSFKEGQLRDLLLNRGTGSGSGAHSDKDVSADDTASKALLQLSGQLSGQSFPEIKALGCADLLSGQSLSSIKALGCELSGQSLSSIKALGADLAASGQSLSDIKAIGAQLLAAASNSGELPSGSQAAFDVLQAMDAARAEQGAESPDGGGMKLKKVRHKKRVNGKKICLVCGDKALAHNFDVITCESCKAFFRRNALKSQSLQRCMFQNSCAIDKNTRRFCPSCRLKKCFDIGMKSELILDEEERRLRQQKKAQRVQRQAASSSTAAPDGDNEGQVGSSGSRGQDLVDSSTFSPDSALVSSTPTFSPPESRTSAPCFPSPSSTSSSTTTAPHQPSSSSSSSLLLPAFHTLRDPVAATSPTPEGGLSSGGGRAQSSVSAFSPSSLSPSASLGPPPLPSTSGLRSTSSSSSIAEQSPFSSLITHLSAATAAPPSSSPMASHHSSLLSPPASSQFPMTLASQQASPMIGVVSQSSPHVGGFSQALLTGGGGGGGASQSTLLSSPFSTLSGHQQQQQQQQHQHQHQPQSQSSSSSSSSFRPISSSLRSVFMAESPSSALQQRVQQQYQEMYGGGGIGENQEAESDDQMKQQQQLQQQQQQQQTQQQRHHEDATLLLQQTSSSAAAADGGDGDGDGDGGPLALQAGPAARIFKHVPRDRLPSDPFMYWIVSGEERLMLANLTIAYQDVLLCLPERGLCRNVPISDSYFITDFLNEIDDAMYKIVQFSKHIPDFRLVRKEDQIAMLKSSAMQTLGIACCAVYVGEKDCWLSLRGDLTFQHLRKLTNDDPYIQVGVEYCRSVKSLVKNDLTIYALIHCMILFDPRDAKIVDRQIINQTRDKFVIMLKHYLEAQFSYLHADHYFVAIQERVREMCHLALSGNALFKRYSSAFQPLITEMLSSS